MFDPKLQIFRANPYNGEWERIRPRRSFDELVTVEEIRRDREVDVGARLLLVGGRGRPSAQEWVLVPGKDKPEWKLIPQDISRSW